MSAISMAGMLCALVAYVCFAAALGCLISAFIAASNKEAAGIFVLAAFFFAFLGARLLQAGPM